MEAGFEEEQHIWTELLLADWLQTCLTTEILNQLFLQGVIKSVKETLHTNFLINVTEMPLFHRHSLRAQILVDDGHDLCNSLNSGFILAKQDRHMFPYAKQLLENWTVL